jgi:hypothetical protein
MKGIFILIITSAGNFDRARIQTQSAVVHCVDAKERSIYLFVKLLRAADCRFQPPRGFFRRWTRCTQRRASRA